MSGDAGMMTTELRVLAYNTFLLHIRLPTRRFGHDVMAAPAYRHRAREIGTTMAGRYDVVALMEVFDENEQAAVLDGWAGRDADHVAGPGPSVLRKGLKRVMTEHFGIFREERRMREGLAALRSLRAGLGNVQVHERDLGFNQSLVMALELRDMFLVAEAVAIGALARDESRGSHWRTDFPSRDDGRFLHHSLVFLKGEEMVLDSSPVRLGDFPVQERVY